MPCFLVISATLAMSVTFIIGLVGVSIYTAFVSGRIYFSTSSLLVSTYSTSYPFFFEILSKSRTLPPYKSSPAIICAPCENISMATVIAAIPDENAYACVPFSRDATTLSS